MDVHTANVLVPIASIKVVPEAVAPMGAAEVDSARTYNARQVSVLILVVWVMLLATLREIVIIVPTVPVPVRVRVLLCRVVRVLVRVELAHFIM